VRVVDVRGASPADAPFVNLDEVDGQTIDWVRFSSLPRNGLERWITRPRLSRYRAALEAIDAAKSASAIISHLPSTALAVSSLARLRGVNRPHLAFSFNFLHPPARRSLPLLRQGFARVTQFAVFTEFEKQLYSEWFALQAERIRPLLWTQAPPRTTTINPAMLPPQPFVTAVGGEGRDFALLVRLARALPEIGFVVVARPNAALDEAPSNMRVMFNVPEEICWGIASASAAVLIPLLAADTCCGHITLVSARMLGLPIITSRSIGTREYSEGFEGTQVLEPGGTEQWAEAIRQITSEGPMWRHRAQEDAGPARIRHDRSRWVPYIADFLRRNA
jgi:hypothetical protein